MDEKKLYNGMTAIAIAVLFALIGLSFLSTSCATKEIVKEEILTVHDTIYSHKTDTLVDIKVITVHDTTRQVENHIITLNNVGDTIKEIHHYHNSEKVIVVDSTNRYKAVVDSLQKALHEQQNTKTEIKQSKKWRGYVLTAIITAAFVIAIIGLVNTKIKK